MSKIIAMLLLLLGICVGITHAEDRQSVPSFSATVVDTTNWLSSQEVLALKNEIGRLHENSKIQIAVLIVKTTTDEPIEQYAMRVAETWKVGKKGVDNGLLFTIAKDDRRFRIDVGYGLEGQLPDITVKHIVDRKMRPEFQAGRPYNALMQGFKAVELELSKERIASIDPAPGSEEAHHKNTDIEIPFFNKFNDAGKLVAIVLGVIGGILLLAGIYGESGGLASTGLIGPLVLGIVLGVLVNIAQCILIGITALIIAVAVAAGVTIGGIAVGGAFGGGGAGGDW